VVNTTTMATTRDLILTIFEDCYYYYSHIYVDLIKVLVFRFCIAFLSHSMAEWKDSSGITFHVSRLQNCKPAKNLPTSWEEASIIKGPT